MKYLVSLSGGKDSTACLLWALENIEKDKVIPYYLDTKWEHHSVYEYLDYLETELKIKIERIESIGMVELCKQKRCMPNIKMRFCSENLKQKPAIEWIYKNFYINGIDFVNILGIRRSESKNRENEEIVKIVKVKYNYDEFEIKTLQPIVYWDTQKVFNYLKSKGIEPNPLYKRGFSRIGCYPCIFARANELNMMESKYKERLRNLENKMSLLLGKKITFLNPDRDKHIRQGNLFEKDGLGCVNQFGICE